MDFNNLLNTIISGIPLPVIIGVIAVILLVYISQYIVNGVERWIEAKYRRQLRIFDHKKIWLSVFWCVIVTLSLAVAEFITWQEVFYYWLLILGASSFLYEAFLKKLGIAEKDNIPEDATDEAS